MGGQYGYQAPESEGSILSAYEQYLPSLIGDITNSITPTAMQEANATASAAPVYDSTNLREMQDYALPETDIGNQVTSSIANANANTTNQVLQGAGGDAAKTAYNLNKLINPNYYTAQDAASSGAAKAISAIDLNGLSPGETNAVERSLNQNNTSTGNLGLVNPTNIVSNAMNFGGAFNNKIGLMNNAVGAASGAASTAASNGGINPVNIALGQPGSMGNFGTSAFQPVNSNTQAGTTSGIFNYGGNVLNGMNSFNSASESAAPQMAATNSVRSYMPNISC